MESKSTISDIKNIYYLNDYFKLKFKIIKKLKLIKVKILLLTLGLLSYTKYGIDVWDSLKFLNIN